MTPIVLAVCLAGLITGTYTDLRTREVPDWVNYGLIFCGFGLAAINSVISWNLSYILESVLGFVFFFAIALLMYYTGQWGGGDSKMIMGLGALVGLSLPFSSWLGRGFFTSGLPMLLNFLIYSIFVGAAYGFLWSIGLAIKNRKRFSQEFGLALAKKGNVAMKKILIAVAAMGLVASFFITMPFRLLVLALVLLLAMSFYMLIFIKTIEKACMLRKVSPAELTIGDWIAEEVKVGDRVICGPKDLGIEKEQIEELKKLREKGKVDKVMIKEGIPFVPSFLIAFLLALFFGSSLFLYFL
jgi:prepilin signal peptidase PulO-like enzyme (type II secretory pathway)